MHQLGRLCNKITDGTHYTPSYVDDGEDKIKFISVKDVREFEISFEDVKYISEEEHLVLSKRCNPKPGDILLTKIGTIGLAAVIPENAPIFDLFVSVCLIQPKKDIINSQFLCIVLNSPVARLQFARDLKGVGVPDLHLENIAETLIPLPPFQIQRSLVAEIEAARQTRKQKLAQADELLSSLDSYLLDQLGLTPPEESDKKVFAVHKNQITSSRLDSFFYTPSLIKKEQLVRSFKPKVVSLVSLLREPPLNGVDARDYEETGQPYLRVQNIRPFDIVKDDVKYVSFSQSKDVLLKAGDVLLTRKGTFGVAAVVSEEAEDCLISSEIILLRMLSNAECSAEYLAAWLNNSLATAVLNRHKTGGIMGHITQDVVSAFPVPIPAEDIQQKIVSEIYQKREEACLIRQQAETEWEAAKTRFERKLLGEEA